MHKTITVTTEVLTCKLLKNSKNDSSAENENSCSEEEKSK